MEFLEISAGAFRARFLQYGARWVSFFAPDRSGRPADVLLGLETPAQYRNDIWSFGAVVGRYANRISGAHFYLDGREVRVTPNHGAHHLHGGAVGFGSRLWAVASRSETSVHFTLTSEDGEEGYPGRLITEAVYRLNDEGTLMLELSATTNAPTVLNLTNHAYFNLAGGGDVGGHELLLEADRVLEVDAEGIPSGRLLPVDGTVFDLRRPRLLAAALQQTELRATGGFDHCFLLSGFLPQAPDAGTSFRAAVLRDPPSGRTLSVDTTAPGLQLYTANGFNATPGRSGRYGRHAGLCLECMHWIDSVHHADWPSTMLLPGEVYLQRTAYRFGVE